MNSLSKYNATLCFVGGLLAGLALCATTLWLFGMSVVPRQDLEEQNALIARLQEQNEELTDDLFRFSGPILADFDISDLPYKENADARAEVAVARDQAIATKKFLMVTFGANWCLDCITLHRHLKSDDVHQYTRDQFLFVNVDIGKFNRNRDVAADLGVDLSRGIPVAIVYDPEGELVGTTNAGELEPARHYSSRQILKFVRDIAERSRISAPDAVQ